MPLEVARNFDAGTHAIHLRHVDVEDNHAEVVRRFLENLVDCLLAISHCDHFVKFFLREFDEHVEQEGGVVGDQTPPEGEYFDP